MRSILHALGLASALATFGCASTSPSILAELDALPTIGSTACDSTDCTVQWQRAQVWLSRHSAWKIQTATDVMLETFNATHNDATYSFRVTREPLSGGRYDIRMEPVCQGHAITKCSPKAEDVKKAFFYYIDTGKDVLDGKNLANSSLR